MRAPFSRLSAVLLAVFAGGVFAGRRLEAGAQGASGAGFSGAWEMKKEAGEDPFAAEASGEGGRTGKEGRGARGGFGSSGGPAGEAVDAPLEAVGDAHRLVIVDAGWKLEITYPTGRKRVLYTDGVERELDDGDGPAKVTAKRKGQRGERVVVNSAWLSDRGLKETWDLLDRPRRLVVEGSVKGRFPFVYRRVYEPASEPAVERAVAPPKAAAATPAPSAVPATAGPAAPPAPVPSPAAAGGAKPECSVRPPRGASRSELAALARITASEAEKLAVASVGSAKVTSVIFSDLEVDDGCLVWPLDLRLEGKSGVQEILIDAGDGKVLSSTFEPSDRP